MSIGFEPRTPLLSPASTPRVLRSAAVPANVTYMLSGATFEDGLPRYFVPVTLTVEEVEQLTEAVLAAEAEVERIARVSRDLQDMMKRISGEVRSWPASA